MIELLIVITIIAILIASATYSWQNAQIKGRDGKRKSDLKAVQQALEFYFQTAGRYPISSVGKLICYTPYDTASINWGTKFSCLTGGTNEVVFMQRLPKDPIYTTTDYYYIGLSGLSPTTYILSAKLENTNDPEYCTTDCVASGKLPCQPASGRNYCVINP